MTRRTPALLFLGTLILPTAGSSQTPPEPSIGIVLSGGGSFGAFEAGALQAFFERWARDHNGAPPPVNVIAGASTGALIAPFAALGPDGVAQVAGIYQNVTQGDILRVKPSVLLPFFLFSSLSSSVFSAGPLGKTLAKKLPNQSLDQIAQMWPRKRLVVLATNFANGTPAPFTNNPVDMGPGFSRFRNGVLASTISPLATPPVYEKPLAGGSGQPHLDGGIHAVTPFQALFELAARSPPIDLTQVVVFSAFPVFPGSDSGAAQKDPFPAQPKFGDIGSRMDALISESSVTKETSLAWAAIKLRTSGVSAEEVLKRTGLNIPHPPLELILIAPDTRLGWNNLKFDKTEMREMFRRGVNATPQVLLRN
jgi:predicted acylesterase/phospholipase RssA